MASDPILQHLYDLLERPEKGRSSNETSPFAGRRKTGTDPHGGFDQNRGRGVGGTVSSPVFGIIGQEIGGKLGKIVIHELDPVTKKPTGYDIELLHTRKQHVSPGDPVEPRQVVGEEGSVGAPASHLHSQVYKGADRTPLNPLRHLYEYHHPGEPVPPLPELSPYSVPPKPGGRLEPLKDPALQKGLENLGQSPAEQAGGASAPRIPTQPVQPNPDQSTSLPSGTAKRPTIAPPLDITPPQFRNPPTSNGGGGVNPPFPNLGSPIYFDDPSSTEPQGISLPMPYAANSGKARAADRLYPAQDQSQPLASPFGNGGYETAAESLQPQSPLLRELMRRKTAEATTPLPNWFGSVLQNGAAAIPEAAPAPSVPSSPSASSLGTLRSGPATMPPSLKAQFSPVDTASNVAPLPDGSSSFNDRFGNWMADAGVDALLPSRQQASDDNQSVPDDNRAKRYLRSRAVDRSGRTVFETGAPPVPFVQTKPLVPQADGASQPTQSSSGPVIAGTQASGNRVRPADDMGSGQLLPTYPLPAVLGGAGASASSDADMSNWYALWIKSLMPN